MELRKRRESLNHFGLDPQWDLIDPLFGWWHRPLPLFYQFEDENL